MTLLATDSADTASLLDLAGVLADASPPVMLAILIVALLRGWLILPRESALKDKRLAELAAEKDEYKALAFKAVGLGERVVSAAERGRP